jgi:hypothetical protein
MLTDPGPDGLIALARRVPMPPEYQLPAGASEHEIGTFETCVGLKVPSQLRAWLEKVNGAMAGPGGLFGARGATDFLSIEKYLKIFPAWRRLGWLPIASDGLGNYWVVVPGPDGSAGWVAFIDVHSDPEAIDYYAASTVFRFLGFLLNSELGEQGWPRTRQYVVEHDHGMENVPESLSPWRSP